MGIETAILGSALVGAAGSYASSRAANKPQKSESSPWAEQQPYLLNGFSKSQDALDRALGMGTYQGQRVADLNPYQTGSADFLANYNARMGAPGAAALGSAGMGFVGYGSQFGGNASDIYGRSTGDSTGAILEAANRFSNNPYVDGMIDAANRDVSRGLNEQALPALARAASGSGNTNSTRAGVESAILKRGAADRMADTAANIRGTLFGQGLDAGRMQFNQNLDNQLRSNNQLLQAFQQGGNTILQGQQVAGNVFDAGQAAGGLFFGNQQANLDASREAFSEAQTTPLALTSQYMGNIGGNYGGTTVSTGPRTSPWGSALTGGLGGGLAAWGTFGRLGGFGTQPVTGAPAKPFGGP